MALGLEDTKAFISHVLRKICTFLYIPYIHFKVRVWCIADAYREILLGENFKILSRFARRLGHVCVHKVPP